MTTTRTDIHAPSSPEFDPEGYTLEGVFDLSPDPMLSGNSHRLRAATVNRLVEQGYRFTGVYGAGQCDHCGHAPLRYAALLSHRASMGLIYVGETCLDNRFLSLTKGEFQALRKAAALNRDRLARKDRLATLLDEHPVLAWASYADNIAEADGWADKTRAWWECNTLADIWWKIAKYAEPSDKQVAFVERLVGRLTEKQTGLDQREAESAALLASGATVPIGRQEVSGTVKSLKFVDNAYGGSLKMLVALDNGTRVYGTVPNSICDVHDGDRVTFTATFKASDRDPLFGFYSRPTKAEREAA